MKRHKPRLILIALAASILILIVGCCIAAWPIQPGCRFLKIGFKGICEFERTFPVTDLLVQLSFFEEPVTLSPIEPSYYHWEAEHVLVEILAGGSQVGTHEIVRWETTDRAREEYGDPEYIGDVLPGPPCGIKSNVEYQSPVADNFCAACTLGGHCTAFGQYEDYLSIFQLDIGSRYTQADFQDIFIKIDERFSDYLKLDTPSN